MGKHISTRRFFSTKSEGDQDSPTRTKRDSAHVGDLDAANNSKTRATAEAWSKKGRFHKPLPTQFGPDGFDYRQVAREGTAAAIYEQTWSGCPNPSISYEVIRIRWREGFHMDGRFVEPAEVYPSFQAWRVDGWTLLTLDAAFAKLRALRSGQ